MKTFLISYGIAFLIMLVIDGLWLGIMTKTFYGKYLAHLMSASPQLLPAALFYLSYILGLILLVVLPALTGNTSLLKVFLLGALLGFVAYGTYDLTNQATLRDWPLIVTVVDLIWGTLLTGTTSALTVFIVRNFHFF